MNRLIGSILLLAALLLAAPAHAARLPTDDPAYAQCITRATQAFGVPELALWVLLDVEGGRLGQVSHNTNSTYDIGPMQVNSWWLKHLAKRGITEDMVLNNLCMNISVGAWILAQEMERHRDLVQALAHYHSPTPQHQRRYLGLIVRAIERRLGQLRTDGVTAAK